jgi:hypothetical protein
LFDQNRALRTTIREHDLAKRKEEDVKRQEEQAKWRAAQAERAVKEKEIKEKIGSEARDKLQRGEKVNWDEFQLMLGSEKEDDSETQD